MSLQVVDIVYFHIRYVDLITVAALYITHTHCWYLTYEQSHLM